MLFEPVANMNLGTFLDATSIFTDRKNLLQTFFECLSVALVYLHENDIRHKNIKSQNILIHVNTLLLTNFDLSADIISDSTSLTSNTSRYCSSKIDDYFRRDETSNV
jgi:serine/threonine protein kinase